MPPGILLLDRARAMIVGDQTGKENNAENQYDESDQRISSFNNELPAEDTRNDSDAGD